MELVGRGIRSSVVSRMALAGTRAVAPSMGLIFNDSVVSNLDGASPVHRASQRMHLERIVDVRRGARRAGFAHYLTHPLAHNAARARGQLPWWIIEAERFGHRASLWRAAEQRSWPVRRSSDPCSRSDGYRLAGADIRRDQVCHSIICLIFELILEMFIHRVRLDHHLKSQSATYDGETLKSSADVDYFSMAFFGHWRMVIRGILRCARAHLDRQG